MQIETVAFTEHQHKLILDVAACIDRKDAFVL